MQGLFFVFIKFYFYTENKVSVKRKYLTFYLFLS